MLLFKAMEDIKAGDFVEVSLDDNGARRAAANSRRREAPGGVGARVPMRATPDLRPRFPSGGFYYDSADHAANRKCECGSESTAGHTSVAHSSWCPKALEVK